MKLKTTAIACACHFAVTAHAEVPAAATNPTPPARADSVASTSAVQVAATELDTIVITGSKEEQSLGDTPAAIGKIDAQRIKDYKPTVISEVLNTVPGVYMPQFTNEQHTMSIRSPLSFDPLFVYLEDGIPIRPLGLFNHNALYEMNLAGIGSVEVVRGASSSLYGSNAVGGAIDFQTRAPSREPSMRAALQTSDVGYSRADLDLSNTWGDFGLRFAGYHFRQRDGFIDYSDNDKDSLTLRGDWVVGDATFVKFVLTHSAFDTQTPGSLRPSQYFGGSYRSTNRFTYRKVLAQRASATVEHEWAPGSLTTATLFTRRNNFDLLPHFRIRDVSGDPTRATGELSTNDFISWGADVRHRWDFASRRARLIAGLYYELTPDEQTSHNLDIVRDPVTGDYLSYTVGSIRRDFEVDVMNVAPYMQFEFDFAENWRLNVGGRYDRIEYDYVNHLVPSPTTGAPSEVRRFSQFSPKIGVNWRPAPGRQIYANASRGFVPPEVGTLYGRLDVPNLRPAIYDSVEIGVRQSFAGGRGFVEATLYRLEGKDEFVNYSIARNVSEPRNAGSTLHRGVEFAASYRFEAPFEARANITYARHTFEDFQVSPTLNFAGNDMKASPRYLANAEIAYTPYKDLRVGLEVQFVDDYYVNDGNTVRYSGHTLWNLRARWNFAQRWTAWANVLNLTDKRYAESVSSSHQPGTARNPEAQDSYTLAPPRRVYVGVEYAF